MTARGVAVVLGVLVVVVLALVGSHFPVVWRWVEVHTGTVNESGPYYGFWSGFGSDIGEVTLIGGAVAVYRAHNCHTKGCWRLARHDVDGTPYKVCRRCHPTVPTVGSTREQIHDAHRRARR